MSTTERILGRPWNTHEDDLLKQAVAIHGENDNWKTIALSVPGRTNKACRKRWLHSLSPTVKKSAWTPDEDRLLLELYAIHSIKWSVIARHIPGRTDDACSKRYREALDPSLKKDEWTRDEDDKLLAIYARLGGKWGQVGQELRRSGLGCRNRWRLLERKRLAAVSNQSSPAHHATVDQFPSSREHSPQNDWPPISMLDVTRYWTGEYSHRQYDADCTTLSSGHLRSFVRTQDMAPASFLNPADEIRDLNAFAPPFYASYSFNSVISQSQMPPVDYPHSSVAPSSFTRAQSGQDHTAAPTLLKSHSPLHVNNAQIPPMDDVDDDDDQMNAPLESDLSENILGGIDELVAVVNSGTRRHSQHSRLPNDSQSHTIAHDCVSQANALDEFTLSNDRPPPHHSNTIVPLSTVSHSPLPSSSRFSPYYRSPSGDRPRSFVSTRRTDPQIPLRLNADLSVTNDPSMRPYACGHRQCCPLDSSVTTSTTCFSTSRELSDHSKNNHADDVLGGGKPFRCSLAGCGKSWKSINGLQYHLQISKAHFQQALSSVSHPETIESPSETNGHPAAKMKSKKLHSCPHPNCSNQYKQLSGLRYHITHGHPNPHDGPAQLDVVPPTLARMVAEKLSSRCPPASR